MAGAIHVHTARSDGTGTVEDIARAAARAGLTFVVFTDHGDATRPPDPPTYRHGVLCLDGVEISTDEGHYLAVGLPAAPYRLGGDARGVVEDVARLGGFGIVAHPVSPKDDLRWREWTAPFDALEWLNGDSEWRDESVWRLAGALLRYPFRPAETIASLFDRPELSLARWDALTRRRRVVALGGVDAHARLSVSLGSETGYEPALLKVPSYEQAFRTVSTRVQLDRPLSGRAPDDARAVLRALREGRAFTVIDALATPPAFDFVARLGDKTARMGEALWVDEPTRDQPVELVVRTVVPPGGEVVLLRDGRPAARTMTGEIRHSGRFERGVYRVEVRTPGAPGVPPVPWLVSNPIYVGSRPVADPPPPRAAGRSRRALYAGEPTTLHWTVERDAASRARLTVGPGSSPRGSRALVLEFALAKGASRPPFVALARDGLEGVSGYDRVSFRGQSSRPLRISVQLRTQHVPSSERWRRSVYLDQEPREQTIFFDELVPVGVTSQRRPPLSDVRALLFVIETANTLPGTSGTVRFEEVRLEGPGAP